MVARAVFLITLCAGFVSTSAGCDPCENRILQELKNPSGNRKAVIFQRNCGTFGGTSTQISILPTPTAHLIAGGNVFSGDTDNGAAPALPSGGPPVIATWTSEQDLQIAYDSRVRVFQATERLGEVAVAYEARVASNKNSQESPGSRKQKSSKSRK
ncbi:MAG: hypothetical protein AB7G75_28355 [Candidatus Binatia bacterium]